MDGDNLQPQQISINVETILLLIDQLYKSGNAEIQARANEQLLAIQMSDQLWNVCWPLLDVTKDYLFEAQFYAANSLFQLINQKWEETDETWLRDSLRPKLIETLMLVASKPTTNRIVIERLSLALAAYTLHALPTFWPTAIHDILKTFQPQNCQVSIQPKTICDIIIQILLFIPEEYAALVSNVKNVRAKLTSQVLDAAPIVFNFLRDLLITDSSIVASDTKLNVLRCCSSWTQHSGSSLLEIDDGGPIIDLIYEAVKDEEQCPAACSALAATFTERKADSFQNSVIRMIPKIAQLSPTISYYINEGDEKCVTSTYSLVVNFAENHASLFIKICLDQLTSIPENELPIVKQSIFSIIKIILDCTSTPGTFSLDEKISELSFPFWFAFFESIGYYLDKHEASICKEFTTLVDSVLTVLLVKLQYPSTENYYKVWNEEQQEAFRCYRQDIGDVLSVIVTFPRSQDRFLHILSEKIKCGLIHLRQNISNEEFKPWQQLESVFFCLKSMSESLTTDEDIYLPNIMNIFNEIPFQETHSLLYCSVCEMLSSLCDWLYINDRFLIIALNILLMGIKSSDKNTRLMSTLSLKDLTNECQSKLGPYSLLIVRACIDCVHPNSSLPVNEKARLMNVLGNAITMLKFGVAMQSLEAILVPIINDLAENVAHSGPDRPDVRFVVINRLTVIGSLVESMRTKFSNLELDYDNADDENQAPTLIEPDVVQQQQQPVLHLLQKLMPLLNQIVNCYRSDEQVMQTVGNLIKRSAKTLQADIKPVAKDLLTMIVNNYEALNNSIILDYSMPIYLLFKMDNDLIGILKESFAAISSKTMDVCQTNALCDLSVTLENYFRYASQLTKKIPELFSQNNNITINTELIYKCALASIELPERRTLVEVCSFLVNFVLKSNGEESMCHIIVTNLQDLIIRLFSALGGVYSTPRNVFEYIGDVLWAVLDSFRLQVNQILKLTTEMEGFPTKYISREEKAQLLLRLSGEKSRKKVKDICGEFCLLSRNLKRS